MANFQTQLKRLRTKKDLSQEQMGKILHCTRYRVADLERGKTSPTIEDINLLCDYFDIPSDYLIGRSSANSSDHSFVELCDGIGLNDEAIMELTHRLNFEKTNKNSHEIYGYLFERQFRNGSSIGFDFSDWNDKYNDYVGLADLLNLLLTCNDFYNLLQYYCDARNSIVDAITCIEHYLFSYSEYENSLFHAYKLRQKLYERLFSKLEKDIEEMIIESANKMEINGELKDGNDHQA